MFYATDRSSTSADQPIPLRAFAIEEALRWCIRDELPKRTFDRPIRAPEPQGLHPMWRAGVFGARIDNWSKEPGMPAAMGEPHPDALKIEEAILALRADDLDLTGYGIGHGLDARANLAHVIERARESVVAWIITCAKQGGTPDLGGGPECEPGKGTRGQVTLWLTKSTEGGVGSDGRPWFMTSDETTTPSRAGEYREGTFCKLKWTRGPVDVADDRAVYAAWHAALTLLAARLGGTLTSMRIKAPAAPATPWIEPPPATTILRSVLAASDVDLTPVRHPVERMRPRAPSPVRRLRPDEYPLAA